MNMMIYGSPNFGKTLRLEALWNRKKASGDLSAHMDTQGNLKPRKTEAASHYQAMIDLQNADDRDGKQKKLAEATEKVANGKRLSPEEEKLLRQENPVLYQRYRSAELERKSYEQELKRCKTKDEVRQARMSHVNSSLLSVKSIEHNSAIPEGRKQELMGAELLRVRNCNEVTDRFVRSGAYARLPSEQEQAEAEKELRELAERRARGSASPTEEKAHSPTEKEAQPPAEKEATPTAPHRAAFQAKPETEEALEAVSPELRKTRRAKARAAYAAAMSPEPGPQMEAEA